MGKYNNFFLYCYCQAVFVVGKIETAFYFEPTNYLCLERLAYCYEPLCAQEMLKNF